LLSNTFRFRSRKKNGVELRPPVLNRKPRLCCGVPSNRAGQNHKVSTSRSLSSPGHQQSTMVSHLFVRTFLLYCVHANPLVIAQQATFTNPPFMDHLLRCHFSLASHFILYSLLIIFVVVVRTSSNPNELRSLVQGRYRHSTRPNRRPPRAPFGAKALGAHALLRFDEQKEILMFICG